MKGIADNGDIFLVIEASDGQFNGVSRTHEKVGQIKMMVEEL